MGHKPPPPQCDPQCARATFYQKSSEQLDLFLSYLSSAGAVLYLNGVAIYMIRTYVVSSPACCYLLCSFNLLLCILFFGSLLPSDSPRSRSRYHAPRVYVSSKKCKISLCCRSEKVFRRQRVNGDLIDRLLFLKRY
jgi:hypothetical protein